MNRGIITEVKNRIMQHGPGWCFTLKHFLDLDSDTGVRSALSRLEQEHIIRRLSQGLYEYPRSHDVLGTLPPKLEEVAKALAEKDGIRIQPSGAYAANLVGLSEQVPAKVIFLTSGRRKSFKIGKLEITLKTATEKTLHATGKVGLAIQAMKNIGKLHIDNIAQSRLARFLEDVSNDEIRMNLKYAPQWIRSTILKITEKK
jgi:hypothetical protein